MIGGSKRWSRSGVWEEGFTVVGTNLTLDGNFQMEVEHRIKKAWAAFAKYRALLLHGRGSVKKRLRLLDMAAKSSMLWGAGAWSLTIRQEQSISGVQRRMIRSMLRIRALGFSIFSGRFGPPRAPGWLETDSPPPH